MALNFSIACKERSIPGHCWRLVNSKSFDSLRANTLSSIEIYREREKKRGKGGEIERDREGESARGREIGKEEKRKERREGGRKWWGYVRPL